MSLEKLIGQLVRVKDRRIVGKKHSAILLAVSRDGSVGYLRLQTKAGGKIQARHDEILPTAFGLEWPNGSRIPKGANVRTLLECGAMDVRLLSPDEVVRVDSLCLGPAHNQDHARWDPAALRRLLAKPTDIRWWPSRFLRPDAPTPDPRSRENE